MKKVTSLIMALVLCLSLSIPAFAADQESDAVVKEVTENLIQSEIQQQEEKVWCDLYRQLEAQNALGLMDAFKQILSSRIENQVRAKYNTALTVKKSNADNSYYFPNGGYVVYTSFNANVVDTYLIPKDAQDYLIDNSYTVGDIIEGVVSFIPGGQIVAVAALMQVITNNSAKRSIKAADGYAEVLAIVSGAESGTYVSGWNNHPYGTIPDVGTTVVDYCAA